MSESTECDVCVNNRSISDKQALEYWKAPDQWKYWQPVPVLQKFNITEMMPYANILILGGPRSGKTTLCTHLAKYFFAKNEYGLIFTNHSGYETYMNDLDISVYNSYDSLVLRNFLEAAILTSKRKNTIIESTIVLDECVNQEWEGDDNLLSLLCSSRFYATNTIIVNQENTIPTYLQSRIDYVFMFSGSKDFPLWDGTSFFKTPEMFQETLAEYTKNYGCLVLDRNTRSHRMEDRVFYY